MSFEHHHYQSNQQQRQLEMRDSAILDRMASSRRSRGQLPSLMMNNNNNNNMNNNNMTKMTPWGTDVLQTIDDNNNTEDIPPSNVDFSTQQQQQHHHGKSHAHHPHDQMASDSDAGSYHCPEVSKTHNHFQNKESEYHDRKLQMTSSRINASHFGDGLSFGNNNDNNSNNNNQDAAATTTSFSSQEQGEMSSTTTTTTAADQNHQNQQPLSPPPEHRKMLHSKINDGHGIFFTGPGKVMPEKDRPGTPRIARDNWNGAQSQQRQQNNNNNFYQEPFQQRFSRGPVKNPWNGYTDSKEKFGGRVDKTGFW